MNFMFVYEIKFFERGVTLTDLLEFLRSCDTCYVFAYQWQIKCHTKTKTKWLCWAIYYLCNIDITTKWLEPKFNHVFVYPMGVILTTTATNKFFLQRDFLYLPILIVEAINISGFVNA